MKKTLLVGVAGAILLTTFSAAFADSTGSMLYSGSKAAIKSEAKGEIKANDEAAREKMKDYKTAFHADAGYVSNYFTKLADKAAKKARNTAVKAAQKTLQDARNQLLKDYRAANKAKTPMTTDAINTRVVAMMSVFHDAVVSYVDPAKTSQFEAFIAGKTTMIENNYTVRADTKAKNNTIKANAKAAIKGSKTH